MGLRALLAQALRYRTDYLSIFLLQYALWQNSIFFGKQLQNSPLFIIKVLLSRRDRPLATHSFKNETRNFDLMLFFLSNHATAHYNRVCPKWSFFVY